MSKQGSKFLELLIFTNYEKHIKLLNILKILGEKYQTPILIVFLIKNA